MVCTEPRGDYPFFSLKNWNWNLHVRDASHQESATFQQVGNLAAEWVVFLELADAWEKDFLDEDNNTNGQLWVSYQPNDQGGLRTALNLPETGGSRVDWPVSFDLSHNFSVFGLKMHEFVPTVSQFMLCLLIVSFELLDGLMEGWRVEEKKCNDGKCMLWSTGEIRRSGFNMETDW